MLNQRQGFEPGALAVVVNAANSENIGRVVELVSIHSSDSVVVDGRPFMVTRGLPAWVVRGQLVSSLRSETDYGYLSESCMIPLKGDFSEEQAADREVAHG